MRPGPYGRRLEAYAAACAALPRTSGITQALRELDKAAARLRATRDAADAAQTSYDETVVACSVAERALRRTAAEHALETERVDAVETANRAFEAAVRQLTGRRREHARQTEAAQAAADRSPPPPRTRKRRWTPSVPRAVGIVEPRRLWAVRGLLHTPR